MEGKNMNSYFSHDSNARNSDKLIKVRMELGAEGYGVYFMILERLREESDYMSTTDYNVISFDLRVDTSVVKRVVEDYGLFKLTEDGEHFYSNSFLRRMELKDEKSKKRAEAGKLGAAKRWKNHNKNSNDIANAIKNNDNVIALSRKNIASKVKESKVKESKVNIILSNDNMSVKTDFAELHSVDYANFLDYWNKHSKLKSITAITEKRKKHLNARFKEHGLKAIYTVIDNTSKSSFMRGNNNRGWIATFDWVFLPNNFVKVLEGNYLDKDTSTKITDDIDRRVEALYGGARND